MELPRKLSVTEQEIDISNLTETQLSYYRKLSERISELYNACEMPRYVVGLSGPPGAGKSVVAALLSALFKEKSAPFAFVNIGLDAFHLPNVELEKHGLKNVKGRYDTYNTDLLVTKLRDFKDSKAVSFPAYSRELHDPVTDAIPVSDEYVVLLLEGQWLLRDTPEWARVQALCDHQFFVSADPKKLAQNTIARHVRGGRTLEDATRFYDESDRVNTMAVLNESVGPDEELTYFEEID